ncbi:MAG: hypothetical protein H5T72_05285 [Actinobacteria bacterium]|nr:hypothetical protein [Actinomycetota bacterium]
MSMRRTILVAVSITLLIVVPALAGCGGGNQPSGETGTGSQVIPGSPVGEAEASACAANRRAISSAVQQYQAVKGQIPTSIQQLVPEFLQSVPACPSGGTYTLTGNRVICSVHGS